MRNLLIQLDGFLRIPRCHVHENLAMVRGNSDKLGKLFDGKGFHYKTSRKKKQRRLAREEILCERMDSIEPYVWNLALDIATSSYVEFGKFVVEENVGPFPLAIGFQGTNSFYDLLYDADIALVPCSFLSPHHDEILVHRGFQKRYLEIRDDIQDIILRKGPKQVLLSGHSLGGALSQCCAMDLSFAYPQVLITCITFGSPKCGNHGFVKHMSQRVPNHIRFFHQEDPVVSVPFGLYRHAGIPVRIPCELPRHTFDPFHEHSTKLYDHSLRKFQKLHFRKKIFDRSHVLLPNRSVPTSLTRCVRI